MKQIGFFGGTFDPIHIGHLNLAIEILEKKGLDQILFCPALVSPTKQDTPPIASPKHRMNMLRLSLEGICNCEPYEGEIMRFPPSYTIDTVKKIDVDKLYLIMAEDTVYDLNKWKDIEELFSIASPLIGTRHGFDNQKFNHLLPNLKLKLEEGRCKISAMDISSSNIRDRLKKRMYCGHLLQGKILDYIHENGLYCM